MNGYPRIYVLVDSKMAAEDEPPIPVKGGATFVDADTVRFAIECQDRSWGPSVDARTLTVRRQADGRFRAHWREVLGLGVASRGLPPWKAELRLDLAIDDEDGGDLAGTWIEDGKVLDWTGQLHLKV